MSKEITVDFYKRKVKGNLVCEGVLCRKTEKKDKSYLIKCSVSGLWRYCSESRMDGLIRKHGDIESVGRDNICREGLKILKEQENA